MSGGNVQYPSMAAHYFYVPPSVTHGVAQIAVNQQPQQQQQRQSAQAGMQGNAGPCSMDIVCDRKAVAKRGRSAEAAADSDMSDASEETPYVNEQRFTYYRKTIVPTSAKRVKAAN
ncbi:hypothetical protein GGI07_001990 [Coemansia sp. Benny D115]|nr:hypothetical protein GGI07_001990 [Coemansia sp. Benny D115]